MSYLRYLCLLAYSGVQHILCCVFLHLLYLMLPVPLDCPILIASSVFSNIYFLNMKLIMQKANQNLCLGLRQDM
jgi:hypothetical protein